MKGVLDKELTLCLNSHWQPIDTKIVRDAIVGLCPGQNGHATQKALRIEYFEDRDGNIDFDDIILMEPLSWDEWIELPVRKHHLSISTSRRQIRVPTVVIAHNCDKMPVKRFKPSTHEIWRRDGNQCQYTGKILPKKDLNVDHIYPVHLGGKSTFENMVLCDKEINCKKGHKTLEEAGLKLIRKPVAPNPVPAWSMIKEARHHDWNNFLLK